METNAFCTTTDAQPQRFAGDGPRQQHDDDFGLGRQPRHRPDAHGQVVAMVMVKLAGTARRPPPCTRLAGPGMFADDHGSTVHLLDGHGYLGSFRFGADSAAYYSAWYVETTAKREEHDVGSTSWPHLDVALGRPRALPLGGRCAVRAGCGDLYELANPTAAAICKAKGAASAAL